MAVPIHRNPAPERGAVTACGRRMESGTLSASSEECAIQFIRAQPPGSQGLFLCDACWARNQQSWS